MRTGLDCPEDRYGRDRDFVPPLPVKGVVFSDIRFKNEMAAVKKAGGFLWRMKRGSGLEGAAGEHSSEAEQREVPDFYFDQVIDNTDISLDKLSALVSEAVEATF